MSSLITNVIALSIVFFITIHNGIHHDHEHNHFYHLSSSSCTVLAWMPTFTPPHPPLLLKKRNSFAAQHSIPTALDNDNPSDAPTDDDHRQKQHHERNQQRNKTTPRPLKKKNNHRPHRNSPLKQRVKQMFHEAKELERGGDYQSASDEFRKILELDRFDSYTHLALAKIESRRERSLVGDSFSSSLSLGLPLSQHRHNSTMGRQPPLQQQNRNNVTTAVEMTPLSVSLTTAPPTAARQAFYNGTTNCPSSVHLWHAWAVHEESTGFIHNARFLFHQVLDLDYYNPYACHALGRLLQRYGDGQDDDDDDDDDDGDGGLDGDGHNNTMSVMELWERPLGDVWKHHPNHNRHTTTNNKNNKNNNNHPQNQHHRHRRPKKTTVTAALVCSLGKLYTSLDRHNDARDLYMRAIFPLRQRSERETSEVYLAAAWLEEHHFRDFDRAEELLGLALRVSRGNSRAKLALARLDGRRVNRFGQWGKPSLNSTSDAINDVDGGGVGGRRKDSIAAVKKRLQETIKHLPREIKEMQEKDVSYNYNRTSLSQEEVTDGRLYNTWAQLELKDGNYAKARHILRHGIQLFPLDYSLLQAAGNLEEKVGNEIGARHFYNASLSLQPSSATFVAYAMLELRSSSSSLSSTSTTTNNNATSNTNGKPINYTKVTKLFEQALLLDPRHGPAYNAYGNMETKRGNTDKAREIYYKGVYARCTDAASVYHGLAKLELSLGNIEDARSVLQAGINEVQLYQDGTMMMDSNKHKRPVFLAHTLGMLELTTNRPAEAKKIFGTAIDRYGVSSQLLLGAAMCEVKLGNENKARQLFRKAVNADRKHVQAWQSWGVMETRAGNYHIAKTLFEYGIQNDKSHGALWQAYATLERRRGDIDAAKLLYARGVVECPDHVALYQSWASLEMQTDNFSKAKTLIAKALTKDKTNGSAWVIAAQIEEKLENDGLVELILKRGLELAPYCAQLYCALAEFNVERGKINMARTLLEKGLEVDPMHAPLYHSLAELEARVFNIEGMAQLHKRAAEIFNTSAMEPPPASMKLLRHKLQRDHSITTTNHQKHTAVAALTKMVEIEFDLDETVIDTMKDDVKDILPYDVISQLSDLDN